MEEDLVEKPPVAIVVKAWLKASKKFSPLAYKSNKIIKIKNVIQIKNSAPNDRGILKLSILSVIGSKKYANKKPIIKGLKISLKKYKPKIKTQAEKKQKNSSLADILNIYFPRYNL